MALLPALILQSPGCDSTTRDTQSIHLQLRICAVSLPCIRDRLQLMIPHPAGGEHRMLSTRWVSAAFRQLELISEFAIPSLSFGRVRIHALRRRLFRRPGFSECRGLNDHSEMYTCTSLVLRYPRLPIPVSHLLLHSDLPTPNEYCAPSQFYLEDHICLLDLSGAQMRLRLFSYTRSILDGSPDPMNRCRSTARTVIAWLRRYNSSSLSGAVVANDSPSGRRDVE